MKVPSIKKLRKICQKKYKRDCLYDIIVSRKISIYLTWLFLHTPITANQVTIFSLTIGFFGCLLFLFKDPVYWIFGFLFLQFFRILDCVDGEIARYHKTAGGLGERIDKIMHKIIDFSFFSTIGIGMYFVFNNPYILALGFSAAFFKPIGFGYVKQSGPKGKINKRSNIVVEITREIGSFFQFVIVPAILDLIFNSFYFRLLFIIVSGVSFPLIFAWRLFKLRGQN